MQDVLVSIITVCLNAEATIERTIRSVIRQTYKNIEYIIIDGGSTDRTLQIAAKYRDDISTLISEKDSGIYDAMNKGIELAHGDYIGIINADDWYEKDAVDYVVQTGKRLSEDIGVISGQCRYIEETSTFLPRRKGMVHIWTEMPIAHPATFIKKSVYEKFGKYDTHYKLAADYELIFRLYVNRVAFYLCEKVLANYTVGGISGTRKDELFIEDIEILNKYRKYCDDSDKVKESIRRKEDAHFIYHADKKFFYKALDIEPESNDRFYIFGCGYWGREICSLLEKHGITIMGFIDNNSGLWGTTVLNHVIEAPDVMLNRNVKVFIAIQGDVQEIETQIQALSTNAKIINLDRFFQDIGREGREKGLL